MNLSREMIKELVETKVPFVERMGIKAVELEPRRVKLSAPLRGNENHIGTMYAGALFTLAEMPVGALFLTTFDVSKFYPIVKEVTIRYLKLAKTDVSVEVSISEAEAQRIRAEASEKGKAEFVLHGEIKDESGQVVAESTSTYQLRAVGR